MASDPESKRRWDKENTSPVLIKFQNKTDGDILEYLEAKSREGMTKQSFIKLAIREYMKNHEGETA